ncbi:MAG: hypothetical protein AAGI53_16055 [Planctomycetota bacterium]
MPDALVVGPDVLDEGAEVFYSPSRDFVHEHDARVLRETQPERLTESVLRFQSVADTVWPDAHTDQNVLPTDAGWAALVSRARSLGDEADRFRATLRRLRPGVACSDAPDWIEDEDNGTPLLSNCVFPHLGTLRQFAVLERVRLIESAMAGDADGAEAALASLVRAVEHASRPRSAISGVVAIRIGRIAARSTQAAISANPLALTAESLARMREALSELRAFAAPDLSFERAQSADVVQRLFRNGRLHPGAFLVAVGKWGTEFDPADTIPGNVWMLLRFADADGALAVPNAVFDRFAELTVIPAWRRRGPSPMRLHRDLLTLHKQAWFLSGSANATLTKGTIPDLNVLLAEAVRLETELNATLLFIELASVRTETGVFPDPGSAVAHDLLARPEHVDPMSGAAFRYRLPRGRLELISTGTDRDRDETEPVIVSPVPSPRSPDVAYWSVLTAAGEVSALVPDGDWLVLSSPAER